MSALSIKAKSIDPEILEVAMIKQFSNCLTRSICVRRVFTTLMESDGSDDAMVLAEARLSTSSIKIHTKQELFLRVSIICSNNLTTSFPLSENHFENKEFALISISLNEENLIAL